MYPFADAARTPHGDSNKAVDTDDYMEGDAARTPHGDSNRRVLGVYLQFLQDAARAPHGDSNFDFAVVEHVRCDLMQPAPLTGTATVLAMIYLQPVHDAARTPHGDSNPAYSVVLSKS